MISSLIRSALLAVLTSGLASGANSSAPSSRDGSDSARSASASAARGGRPPARGILPDPMLLDGSGQPAEKRPEQGMLGNFELPGDDNVRNVKAGGAQTPPGEQAGAAEQKQGGGGKAQGAQAGGSQPKNPQAKPGTDGGNSGPTDPNAKAEGIQVAQLEGAGAEGQAGLEGPGNKPQAVSIGDSAMQIKTVANAPGIVGATVPAGQTQQMEKNIGGGRGSTPLKGGGRSQTEKGRAMPAGL